jgi:probable rRNA maturation factor
MSELYVRNRQRTRPVNLKLLQKIVAGLVPRTCPGEFRVGILLVGEREMARLNEAFLRHEGSTDVLAFGYATGRSQSWHGELFICIDEAVRQARRYRTSWQEELVRYIAHGLLHFQGYDDATAAQRRKMKAVEDALLRDVAQEFSLSRLSRKPRVR